MLQGESEQKKNLLKNKENLKLVASDKIINLKNQLSQGYNKYKKIKPY